MHSPNAVASFIATRAARPIISRPTAAMMTVQREEIFPMIAARDLAVSIFQTTRATTSWLWRNLLLRAVAAAVSILLVSLALFLGCLAWLMGAALDLRAAVRRMICRYRTSGATSINRTLPD